MKFLFTDMSLGYFYIASFYFKSYRLNQIKIALSRILSPCLPISLCQTSDMLCRFTQNKTFPELETLLSTKHSSLLWAIRKYNAVQRCQKCVSSNVLHLLAVSVIDWISCKYHWHDLPSCIIHTGNFGLTMIP